MTKKRLKCGGLQIIFCQASHFCPAKLPFLSCLGPIFSRGGPAPPPGAPVDNNRWRKLILAVISIHKYCVCLSKLKNSSSASWHSLWRSALNVRGMVWNGGKQQQRVNFCGQWEASSRATVTSEFIPFKLTKLKWILLFKAYFYLTFCQ